MNKIFSTSDAFLINILCFIALFTRLWLISEPSSVIFDEVHFGNFSNWYINNKFHFDIHPPLGKILMALIAKLTQYKGDIVYASKLGTSYEINELFYVSQRITPAIFSAFTAPLIYTACKCLSISTFSSFAAGLILTTDMSIIVEGKFILSDGMLHFFTALHIFTLCLFLNKNLHFRAILTGITLGAACACKYTALGLFAVDGITQIFWIINKIPSFKSILIRAFEFLIPSFIIFMGSWILHFLITPFSGYNSEYLIPQHQNTIIEYGKSNFSYWGNRLIGSNLYERIIHWNIVMNRINMRSDIPHPYESQPIYWPFLLDKFVGFYHNNNKEIHCLGSPAVYWLSSISLILTFLFFLIFKFNWKNSLLLWSWTVSYIPFILVPRTMFMYHYIVPLMFAVMNMCVFLDIYFPKGYRESLIFLILFLCIICYFYFYPWIYGTECFNCHSNRLWLKRWIKGAPLPIYKDGINLFNTSELFGNLPL